MKLFKLFLFVACVVISMLNISNFATKNSLFSPLNQLNLVNLALAQSEIYTEVDVSPNKGNPDTRTCTYYTTDWGIDIGFPDIIQIGQTLVEHSGTMTICLNDNDQYCDYIGCH